MGKIKGHSLIKEVSGSMGQDLYVRKSGRNTIVSRKGVIRRSTKGQQANRERFAKAALHSRGALIEPELSRAYTIIGMLQGINAKNAAISDYLSQPEIESVQVENYNGNIGDSIVIKDKYILKLTSVEVSISTLDGTLIEQGKAVPCRLDWQYRATVRNPSPGGTRIAVTGIDRLKRSVTKIAWVDR